MGQRFFVNRSQPVHWRVCICRRLKVRQKVVAIPVAEPHPGDALVDLPKDARPRQAPAGTKAAIVTKRAAACSDRTIYVGAGKAGVDAHFLHSPAKPLAEPKVA